MTLFGSAEGAPGRGRARLVVLSLLAAVGASLLAVIIATFWMTPGDDLAYWIAGYRLATGQPIYLPPEIAFDPFAFHYAPPVAQVLAPITLVLSELPFAVVYRSLLLLALWELAGRRMLSMLALIAFIPMAVAVRIENVEIFMALGIVLGLGRWPWLFTIGAIVKISPGLGIVYLALRRQWRDFWIAVVLGVLIVAVSYVLAPHLWWEFFDTVTGRVGIVGQSLIPVPYVVRAIAGLVLTVAGGLLGRRRGELLLVAGITIANPGLSLQGFAVLAAAIPVWLAGPEGLAGRRAARARSASRAGAPAAQPAA